MIVTVIKRRDYFNVLCMGLLLDTTQRLKWELVNEAALSQSTASC